MIPDRFSRIVTGEDSDQLVTISHFHPSSVDTTPVFSALDTRRFPLWTKNSRALAADSHFDCGWSTAIWEWTALGTIQMGPIVSPPPGVRPGERPPSPCHFT